VTVSLREITDENEASVRALRTTVEQEQFVSTVDYSLREAAREPEGNPWYRAIYADDQPVGFVMVAWNVTPRPPEIFGPWYLWKLIVDHRHQGKGYGQAAVRQVIELIRAEGARELLTSYVPGEGSPAGFYARLGFVATGELNSEGETVMRRSTHE
jgi:GNAT superfamily N-acetyltransferase